MPTSATSRQEVNIYDEMDRAPGLVTRPVHTGVKIGRRRP